MKDETVSFGSFRLDIPGRRLLCREQVVPLRPKAWEVLCLLAERRGQVVSIDGMLNACWPNKDVGPSAVSNIIYVLRSVFVDGGGDAAWLRSVARRGYLFDPSGKRSTAPQPHDDAAWTGDVAQCFVGREAEIAQLANCWQLALHRTPQVVFVGGQAGIGKTALVDQFLRVQAKEIDDPPYVVAQAQCIDQGSVREPYMPMIEALEVLAADSEVVEVAREHAPTWLLQMPWLLSSEERRTLHQALAGSGPARMLREGRQMFTRLAERAPLLLLLQDAHWSDVATVDLVRALAESDTACRLMLIVTFRSTEIVVQKHPLRNLIGELPSRRRNVVHLALGSLSPRQVRDYLDRRFASPDWAAEVARSLEDRSGGNPLFLTAITNYLCEQQRIVRDALGWQLRTSLAAVDLGLPDSLRDMIRTHVRQLGAEPARTLAAASVAGIDFTSRELAAALAVPEEEAAAACERIADGSHFIRAHGSIVWPDGSVADQYRFYHAAYHQALNDDIQPRQRRLWHARIGQCLEVGFGKRAREIAPRLAGHFAAALDLERELEYLGHSVRLAAERYAHRETVAYMDRALDVLARLPATNDHAIRRLGWQAERSTLIMDWQGYAASYDSFATLLDLARGQKSTVVEFIGHAGCSISALMSREHRDAARPAAEAMFAIAEDGHPELMAMARLQIGCVSDSFGDPEQGLAHAEAARAALADALSGIPRAFDVEALIHVLAMTCLTRLGRLDRAREERALAIRRVESKAGLCGQAHALAFAACDALISAEPLPALELARRAIDVAREGGFEHFADVGEAALEVANLMLTADDSGLDRLATVITKRQQRGENWYNMLFSAHLADGYRRAGDAARARALIDASFADAEPVYVPELWRIKGGIDLAAGGTIASAAECLQTAISLAQQHRTKLFELRAAVDLARLHRGRGGSGAQLASLYGSFSEGFDSDDLTRAAALLEQFDQP